MSRLVSILVGSLTFVRAAHAQTGTPQGAPPPDRSNRFAQLVDATIAEWRANTQAIHLADEQTVGIRKQHRQANVALRTPSIDRASAASAIEIASVAVRTTSEDVEAGVSIAPVALFGGAELAHQPILSIAALEDDQTRYAIGYNYQSAWQPQTPADIGLESCEPNQKQVDAFRKAARAIEFAYIESCDAVSALAALARNSWHGDPPDPGPMDEARAACEDAGPHTEDVALDRAASQIETFLIQQEKQASAAGGAARNSYLRIVGPRQQSIDRLTSFKAPSLDCYKSEAIKAALAHTSWTTPSYRLGASLTLDTFANVFGFNPDPDEPLAKGQPARAEARLEFARITGRFEWHVGVGAGRSREEVNDDLKYYVAPSVSVAGVVASLSGDPLYAEGKLNALDGEPPPRLVVGFDGEFQYTFDRLDTQETPFSNVELTAFADFLFTKELGFRLGVPFKGDLVTREANAQAVPPVTKLSDIQWSIPIFLTTVLKM